MTKTRTSRSLSETLFLAGRYLPLIVVALIFVFPVVFMIMSSLKPDMQLMRDTNSFSAFLPVGNISMDNYRAAFARVPIAHFIFNSLVVTAITVVGSLFLCSMAGFAITFMSFKGRKVLLAVLVATLIIPFETIAIPLLLLVNALPWIGMDGFHIGWLNTYHVQIVPFLADGLTVFLFVQSFKDLPGELIEAARLDGSNWFQVYANIIVPISGPVFATAAILKFLAMYNQYMWPLMTAQSEQFRPVLVGLQYFFQLDTAWGEVMAYLTIITLPVLLFYFILQRAFIASIASTGVKG